MSFSLKPKPLYLIKDGIPLVGVQPLFDLKQYSTPLFSLCHLEVLTGSYKLNGLLKNNPPEYDAEIASQSEILLEELNFQNKYNLATNHAVQVDILSRDDSSEDWNLEASKLIYRTGMMMTNIDLLYPHLTNANIWLMNPTTEVGVRVVVNPESQFLNNDFLSIKSGAVVKFNEDTQPASYYQQPLVFNLTPMSPVAIREAGFTGSKIATWTIHTPTTNAASVFIRYGDGQAGTVPGSYHLEIPPGYNNPAFNIPAYQRITVISPSSATLVIG